MFSPIDSNPILKYLLGLQLASGFSSPITLANAQIEPKAAAKSICGESTLPQTKKILIASWSVFREPETSLLLGSYSGDRTDGNLVFASRQWLRQLTCIDSVRLLVTK